MAAPPTVNIRGAPPPVFVENLFFKSYSEVVLPKPVEGLIDKSTQCLDCSNKFGSLFVAGQENLLILRAEDVLSVQLKATNNHQKQVDLSEIPHIFVQNSALESPPNVVSISTGEEFIALDTLRNGVPFVLIFKLEQFLTQAGNLIPHCEIRASTQEGSRVSGIAWNPGESMNNMLAINCDDGSLQLATVKGEKSVEMFMYNNGGVKSMCWSPKGKQLVVGKINGSLIQLKLDLSEAKQIPGPGNTRVPSTIFWSSTTQFLVNFVTEERDIDFAQLDLAKGSPPTYSNFGDIFISDKVTSSSKCFFIPILSWNVMLCTSNTINDVIVIAKGLQGNDNWTVAEINDNRRAAIPMDSFAVGSALFTGYESRIIFNEVDAYGSMPVLFMLSNAGVLCSVSLVNSNPSAPSVFQKIPNPLPSQIFTIQMKAEQPIKVPDPVSISHLPQVNNTIIAPAAQLATNIFNTPSTAQASQPQGSNLFNFSSTTPQTTTNLFDSPSTVAPQPQLKFSNMFNSPTQPQPPIVPQASNLFTSQTTAKVVPNVIGSLNSGFVGSQIDTKVQPQPVIGSQPIFNPNSLSTSLPSLQQVEDLKRIVEEKRAQGGLFGDKEEEEDYEIMALDLEKFYKRLAAFKKNQAQLLLKTKAKLEEVCKRFEEEVLSRLNIMEDFVAVVEETTNSQKEEINGLKDRVLSRFTQLEYAKSLAERNKDKGYIQLLRAQSMDPATLKKFEETEKLFHYVKNQLTECDRFFNIQNREPQPLQGAAAIQVIYQTLSNHSRIIKKLAQDLNVMRAQMGLRKSSAEENIEIFQLPSMGYGYYEKKPLIKSKPSNSASLLPKIKSERISVDDLTAGITRVKLNRESELPHRKPLKISAKKLEVVTKAVSKTIDIEVSNDWVDPIYESTRKHIQTRKLINQLDDKIMPPNITTNASLLSEALTTTTTVTEIKTPGFFGTSLPLVSETSTTPSSELVFGGSPAANSTTSGLFSRGALSTATTTITNTPSSMTPVAQKLLSTALTTDTETKTITPGFFGATLPLVSETSSTTSTTSSSRFFSGGSPAPAVNSKSNLISGALTTVTTSDVSATSITPPGLPTSISLSDVFKSLTTTATETKTSGFLEGSTTLPNPSAGFFGASLPIVSQTTSTTSSSIFFSGGSPAPAANSISSGLFSSGGAFSSGTATTSNITSITPGPGAKISNALTTEKETKTKTTGFFGTSLPAVSETSTTPSSGLFFGGLPAANSSGSSGLFSSGTLSTTTTSTSNTTSMTPGTQKNALLSNALTTGTEAKTLGFFGGSLPSATSTTPSSGLFFGGSPAANSTSSGLFSSGTLGTATTTTTNTTLTPGAPTNTLLSNALTTGTETKTPGFFGGSLPIVSATSTTPSSGLFFGGSPAANSTSSGLFSSGTLSTAISTTTTTTTTNSLLSNALTTGTETKTPGFFGGSLPVSATSTTSSSGLFFGGTVTNSTSSLFGGTPSFSSTPAFGSPVATTSPSSVFGGAPAFGSTTAFGSTGTSTSPFGGSAVFGSTTAFGVTGSPSTFGGGGGGGSIFGGNTAQQSAPSLSTLAQAAPIPQQGFGSFGSSNQSTSLFGGQQTLASNTSPFGGQQSQAFGSPVATTSSSSVFGSHVATTSPSSPFGGTPAFGSTTAFGSTGTSTSPFGGSAVFGSAPVFGVTGSPSTFGGGGSIFGGNTAQQSAPSFATLAQAAPIPQQGFGSFGSPNQSTSLFGGQQTQTSNTSSLFGGQQQAQASLFGQPQQQQQQQQQQPTSFGGGSAFSSWR